jgi:hypothetical protein
MAISQKPTALYMNEQDTENRFEFLKGDKVLWMVILVISIFSIFPFILQVRIWNILLITGPQQVTLSNICSL